MIPGGRVAGIALLSSLVAAAGWAQPAKRVLLIPLDDRPSSLQFPTRIGAIGGVTVVTPPRALLGRFTEPGHPERIAAWILQQPLARFDAAIVSIDMLAYGGLVASRVGTSGSAADAERRLEVLREIKRKVPRLPILASSAIMRLAPTADGSNEAYRVDLARWAELSPAQDSVAAREIARLETRIPAAALVAYHETRARNARVNLRVAELVRDRTIDQVLFTQDDARAHGVHRAERTVLDRYVEEQRLADRIMMQAGTDEAGMLLLARAVLTRARARLRVAPVYSSVAMQSQLMPYEDEPLERTVEKLIRSTGAEVTPDTAQADLLFFVHTSRAESATTAEFAAAITRAATHGARGVVVADIDPKGDVQGADTVLAAALIESGAFARLEGYASWNTASNTIGTALAQGVVHRATRAPGRAEAQAWFLTDRWLDDVVYRRLLRPEAAAIVRAQGWNPAGLTREQGDSLAHAMTRRLRDETARRSEPFDRSTPPSAACRPMSDVRLVFPWARLFEVELAFDVTRGCVRP
jgi:hypothetical protein